MNEQTVLQGAPVVSVSDVTHADGSQAVVQLAADLVAARLPVVRAKLREMVAAGVRHLTLDMAGVQMVDSAGIGLLISAHNSLKKAGGSLTVIHASAEVMELFKTMRIHQHFTVSGS